MNIELDDYSQTEAFEETELQESSKIETFEVTLDLDGERLDKVLASSLKDISRSRLKTLIEDGLVKVNGKTVDKPKEKMSFGDEVSVEIKPRLEDMDFIATPMDIDVVYEDDDILVINKPARLVVHPAAGHWDDTLLNGLLAYNTASRRYCPSSRPRHHGFDGGGEKRKSHARFGSAASGPHCKTRVLGAHQRQSACR